MKKVIYPTTVDSDNSVDLYDGDRKNEFGKMWCVASAISPRQIDKYWDWYVKDMKQRTENC